MHRSSLAPPVAYRVSQHLDHKGLSFKPEAPARKSEEDGIRGAQPFSAECFGRQQHGPSVF